MTFFKQLRKVIKNSPFGPFARQIYVSILKHNAKKSAAELNKNNQKMFHDQLNKAKKMSDRSYKKFAKFEEAEHLIFIRVAENDIDLKGMLNSLLNQEDSSKVAIAVCSSIQHETALLYNLTIIDESTCLSALQKILLGAKFKFISYFDSILIPISKFIEVSENILIEDHSICGVYGKTLDLEGKVISAGASIELGSLTNTGEGLAKDDLSINYTRKTEVLPNYMFTTSRDTFLQAISGLQNLENINLAISRLGVTLGGRLLYYPSTECVLVTPAVGQIKLAKKETTSSDFESDLDFERIKLALQIQGFQKKILKDNGTESTKLVFIDADIPRLNHDAGSDFNLNVLNILAELQYEIVYISAFPSEITLDDLKFLHQKGIRVYASVNLEHLQMNLRDAMVDKAVVFVNRVTVGRHVIPVVRNLWPEAKIIFSLQDLHFMRELRAAKISNNKVDLETSYALMKTELSLIEISDETLVVSDVEKEIIEDIMPQARITKVPLIYEARSAHRKTEMKHQIVFVGGFNHLPNVDAVKYFKRNIWPIIREKDSELQALIIGSNPTQDILDLHNENEGFIVAGFVEDLSKVYSESKAFIAPLLYGAGVKGKVIQALSFGLPGIVSKIAAEGTLLSKSNCVYITDDPLEFASYVLNLCTDEGLNHEMSENGLRYVLENHSLDVAKSALSKIVSKMR
jgi:glycosyltransferase involved in cell wall biosynthesis